MGAIVLTGFMATRKSEVGRPLLAGGDPRAAMERLLGERAPVHAAAADVTLDTTVRTIDEVVEDIRGPVARVERRNRCTSST
jgi:shikimate kinase